MTLIRRPMVLFFLVLMAALGQPLVARATTTTVANGPVSAYVLGDSIANGLQLAGLEAQLQAQLGGPARINFDGGRLWVSVVSGYGNIEAAQLSQDTSGRGATVMLRLDRDVPADVRATIRDAVDASTLEVVDLS